MRDHGQRDRPTSAGNREKRNVHDVWMVGMTRYAWRTVEQLVPGDLIVSLQPWQFGANIDRIAARHNVRAKVIARETNAIGSVRITLATKATILRREFRPGTALAIEIQSHDADNVLPNVGTSGDTESLPIGETL